MEFHKAKSKELRKTNFFIGKHYPEYKSAYSHSFTKPRAFSAALDDSLRSTQTHFTFGTTKKIEESEAKSRFKSSDSTSSASPQGINRLETTKHHFDLGSDPSKFATTANENYKKSENNTPGDYRIFLNQNRRMNFTFGTDTHQRPSITKSDFQAKNGQNSKKDRESIRTEQKSTHYYIGEARSEYKTSHNEEYSNKFNQFKPRYYSPNKYNLKLGEFKSSFETVNKDKFDSKPISAQACTSTTVSAMRNTHFILGEDTPANRTVSQDTYSSKTLNNASHIHPETKMTSVKLGTSKPIWDTSSKTLSNTFYKVEKADYPYKGSFVVMGFDSKKKPTTTQDNYIRYAGVNINNLDGFTSEDIKKRHFSFGSSDVRYQTCSSDHYSSKKVNKQVIDPKLKDELRNVHYSFGNDGASMMSTTMAEFTMKTSPRSEALKQLKEHSIVLGNYQNKWLTMKGIEQARKTIG